MAADASGIADAVAVAYKVLDETFRRFSRSQVTLSFNGGKDCTVVLHLLRQYFQDRAADGDVGEHPPGTLGGVRLVFFAAPNPFPEVTAFIDRVLELYGLKLETYDGFKSGLSALAADGIKAVMLVRWLCGAVQASPAVVLTCCVRRLLLLLLLLLLLFRAHGTRTLTAWGWTSLRRRRPGGQT